MLLAVDERVGHDDVDGGDVAVGDEPLLAVDHPAAVVLRRGRLDPRRVGAGVGLGDRVGVVQLAAQRGLEVALDLLGRAVGQHVVGAGHVPGERVGGAAELLLDEEPLGLATSPGRRAPGRAGRRSGAASIASRLMRCVQLVGDLAAGALGQLLVRDQDLVDEAPRAVAQVELLGREVRGGASRAGGAGVMVMRVLLFASEVRASRLSWLSIDVEHEQRACAPRAQRSAWAARASVGPPRADVRRPGAPAPRRDTSRSARARSASTAAALGTPPARSVATPRAARARVRG